MIALRAMRASLAVASLLALCGCGLKGPLYLPDDGKEPVARPASSEQDPAKRRTTPIPAPQSQKDRDTREPASPVSPQPAPGDIGSSDAPAPPDPDRPADSIPAVPPDLR